MTVRTYWQLDPAAEPHRCEPQSRRALPGLVTDPRGVGSTRYDYYAQIGIAAAHAGFDGLLIRHRPATDDSRIIAAALAREVPRLELVTEFPVAAGSAVYAAKQAVTFQRATGNRLGWALAREEDAARRRAEGDHAADDTHAARADEFLQVARGVHGQRPFTFMGDHFAVAAGGFDDPLSRAAFPLVYGTGGEEEDLALSARLADVHLFAAGPAERLAHGIEALDELAKRADRTVAFGLVQPVVAREFADEAAAQAARQPSLSGTLVGSDEEVAARLADLAALGITHFVFSATPSLEEAYRFGQSVLPRLRARLAPLSAAA